MLQEIMFVHSSCPVPLHPLMDWCKYTQRFQYPGITFEKNDFIDDDVCIRRCFDDDDDNDEKRQNQRNVRMHELSAYTAPHTFCIPSQTGLMITTTTPTFNTSHDFLTFLVYNEFKDVEIRVQMGTQLPCLLNVMEFTRCPFNVYECLLKENERINQIMTNYFTHWYIPLMKDDSHETDAEHYYNYDDDDDDDEFDPVRLLFTVCNK